MNSQNSKNLVAYFSREGKNIISSGDIIDLPVGNTEVVAQMIQEATGSDRFRIEAVNPYPEDYRQTTEMAKKEQRANARPELTAHVENMDAYDVIFLGYPNWWSTMPMPVFTFLEEYDFAGKTIAPFCTHEGSSLGRSVTDIKALCPHSTVLDGLAVRGSDVQRAREQVSEWLRRLGAIEC
ncbi:MAG: flavodoxin [Halobacteriota archaeon]